jgi:hypothetical protein
MILRLRIICSILSAWFFASCALLGDATYERVVRVKVLADPALRQRNPSWDNEVRGLIEAASDYYEREFNVRFITQSTAPWPARERISSTAELLAKLKTDFPLARKTADHDLIVAFTGETASRYTAAGRPRVDRIGNCYDGLGYYAVVPVREIFRYGGASAELTYDNVALVHELGHIFGAVHVTDGQSIMNEIFDYRTEFDLKNRDIILKNRKCPFAGK